jgi:secreted Zn-dependent insulinase-like peptidase
VGERKAAPREDIVSVQNSKYRLLHKPDAVYRVPKAVVKCLASTPAAYQESANAAVEAKMFALALADALEVPLYHASLGGYHWSIHTSSYGLEVSVGGYSGEGLALVAKKLSEAIANPPSLPQGRFEALLNLQRRSKQSERHLDLFRIGFSYLSSQALVTPAWSWEEQLQALDGLTMDAVMKRMKLIRAESAVTCLAQGDVSHVKALELSMKLASATSLKQLPYERAPLPGAVALPKQDGFTEFRAKPLVENESNALAILVYQLEPTACPDGDLCQDAIRQAATMILLSQVVNQRAFDQLRTKESLGYIAQAWTQPDAVEEAGGKNVWSLRLLVQSGRKSATYVHSRETSFLEGFLKQLEAKEADKSGDQDDTNIVTDEDIELAKHGVIAALMKKPDGLADEIGRMWSEVVMRREGWSRPWLLAKAVPELTRKDVADVVRKVLQPGGPGRRASIEVWRSEDGNPFSKAKTAVHIDDAAAVRKWKEGVKTWSEEL